MNELSLRRVEENLIDYLPEWKKIFSDTPSFKNLSFALYDHLQDWDHESELKLIHAKSVFDNLCESDPEGLRVKEQIKNRITLQEKERDLALMFKEYMNQFKD